MVGRKRRNIPVVLVSVVAAICALLLTVSAGCSVATQLSGQRGDGQPSGVESHERGVHAASPSKPTKEEVYLYGALSERASPYVGVRVYPGETLWNRALAAVLFEARPLFFLPTVEELQEAKRHAGNYVEAARQQHPGVDLDALPAVASGVTIAVMLRK